jgi:hypothetical protein
MTETTKDTPLFLQLTVEEINLILAALQELPAKVSNPLTQKIHEQARPQLDPEVTEVQQATAE